VPVLAVALTLALALAACTKPAPVAPEAPPAPAVSCDALITKGRNDGLPEAERLDAYHDALGAKCPDAANIAVELDSFVDELALICAVQEIRGGETHTAARLSFSRLRRAIHEVGGPKMPAREASTAKCVARVAEDNCSLKKDAADWKECLAAESEKLLHP
jgi:hypothetical protein